MIYGVFCGIDVAKVCDIEKFTYLCSANLMLYKQMKTTKTDSTANVSRFARDKRQRVSSASSERVERGPRQRRDGDNEGNREYRPRVAKAEKRTSFNPHFTPENRLRPEYETPRRGEGERSERAERGFGRDSRDSRGGRPQRAEGGFKRNERTERSERPQRTERGGRNERFTREGGERTERNDRRAATSERRTAPKGEGKRGYAPRRDEKPRSYPKYNPNRVTGEIRLNRFISQSGVCSRREADDYILAGLVTVNGEVVTELGTKIMPTDEVRFNDERLQGEKHVYIVLNKPKGYVTSLDDPHADKTVMDLVRDACTERVYPVGRLDKNSLGLLLITNDGDVTRQLTHPSNRKKKIYQVTLDKALTRADMDTLTEGITLEDGDIFADEVAYASEDKKTVGVEIHSGRNRIVRRMFEHLGYTVQKLDRVYYAGLTKKNLKRGAWRFLTKDEVMRLKTGQYE